MGRSPEESSPWTSMRPSWQRRNRVSEHRSSNSSRSSATSLRRRRPPFRPVELIFAGLVLEYVPLVPALRFIRSGLESGGIFGCVVQQESESLSRVSPSPFKSLEPLTDHMRMLTPEEVVAAAARTDLRLLGSHTLEMPNGKVLASQAYASSARS